MPTAQKETKEDFLDISVNEQGQVQLDKELFTTKEALLARLQALYAQNKDQKFLISADKEARHGDVITVLGELRAAGFQKVAFSIDGQKSPVSAAPAPAATSAPVAASTAAPAPLAPPADSAAGPAPGTTPVPDASAASAAVTPATPASASTVGSAPAAPAPPAAPAANAPAPSPTPATQ